MVKLCQSRNGTANPNFEIPQGNPKYFTVRINVQNSLLLLFFDLKISLIGHVEKENLPLQVLPMPENQMDIR